MVALSSTLDEAAVTYTSKLKVLGHWNQINNGTTIYKEFLCHALYFKTDCMLDVAKGVI